MLFCDHIKPKGVLRIYSIMNGSEDLIYEDLNVVTYAGRSMINYACAGERPIDPISHIAVGTGGYFPDPVNPNINPPPPTEDDLQLNIEILRKPVVTPVNHTTRLSSVYEIWLNENEVVNIGLTEFGVFTQGNILFARRTTKPIIKIPQMILRITWTFLF